MSIALWNEVQELKQRLVALETQYDALRDQFVNQIIQAAEQKESRPVLSLKKNGR